MSAEPAASPEQRPPPPHPSVTSSSSSSSSSSSTPSHPSLTTIPSLLHALTTALSHIETASLACDAELQAWRRRTARLDRARLAYADEAAERARLRAAADTLLRALAEETSEATAELAFEQARDKAARKVDAATRLATRDVGRAAVAAAAAAPPPQAQAQPPAAPAYCTAEVAALVEARLLPAERRAVLLELSKRVEANRVETEAVRAAGVIQPMQELLERLGVRRVRGGAGDGGGLWWRALERKLGEAADGAVAARGGGGGSSNAAAAAAAAAAAPGEVEAQYLKGAVDAAMELLGLVEEAKGLGGAEGDGGEGEAGGRRPSYAYGDWKVLFPLWYLADRLLATTADGASGEQDDGSALRAEMACAARVCEALRKEEARGGSGDGEGGDEEVESDAADAAADSEFVDDYLADFFSDVGGGGGGGGTGEVAAASGIEGNDVDGGSGCREEGGDGPCPAQRSLRHVEESVLAPLFLRYASEGGCDEASWSEGGGGDGGGGVSDEHYCKLAVLRLFSALSLHHGVFLPPVAKTVRPSHPPLSTPPC